MHPWHDVELGEDFPGVVPAVVEIPAGSKGKFEMDKKTGLLTLDRVLRTAARYPMNYGFVPRTIGEDGDPLDMLVLGQDPIPSLTLLRVRVLGGVLIRSSQKGEEHKLIGAHVDDPEYEEYRSLKKIPSHRMEELRQFFETYQDLVGKKIKVREWFGRGEAERVLRISCERYVERFGRPRELNAA